jgi:hypothetical protein
MVVTEAGPRVENLGDFDAWAAELPHRVKE